MRARALANILRSKLGYAADLASAARHREVLEAGFVEAASKLYMLSGMLDRVTAGVAGHSTREAQIGVARAETFDHAAVIRYVLQDCLIHPRGVEYKGGSLTNSPGLRHRIPTGRMSHSRVRHYCMSNVSHRYFGHWLRDSCTTALLAPDAKDIVLDGRPDWPDTEAYAQAFGLPTRPAGAERVDELHVYQDFSQGMSKRGRYAELRARLRSAVPVTAGAPRPVYLRRGATGVARRIADEDAFCDALAGHGFDILDLAKTGFADRYRTLSAATVVVTVEGSQANHAFLAMPTGANFVSLIPADRFGMIQRGVCHAMGLRYGCVVVSPGANGYTVDAGEVLRTVDMMR